MLETIKEYLVSLGFAVDKGSYEEATKAVDEAGKSVSKFAGGAAKNFGFASAAVVSFVATSSIGIAKFIGDLAQADLANEKLARQLWTSKDAAAAYNNTLKAMGVTLQDLYLSPELMRNFQILREQANDMRAPAEYNEQMRMIRSIQFEFVRMKLEATYALQWIGYYFIKYMGGPIGQIKKTLQDINATIVKTMPTWTKNVAEVMSWFARMGITTVRAIKDMIQVFNDIGSAIPRNVKLIGAAIAGLALLIETGPIGIIIAGLTGLILLLDDFYTYLGGGQSALGPFWSKLQNLFGPLGDNVDKVKKSFTDLFDKLQNSQALDNLKAALISVDDILKQMGEAAFGTGGWIDRLYTKMENRQTLDGFVEGITNTTKALKELSATFDDFLKSNYGKNMMRDLGDWFNSELTRSMEYVTDLISGIMSGLSSIFKLLHGDTGGAWDDIKSFAKSYWDHTKLRAINDHNDLVGKNGGVMWGSDGRPVAGPPVPSYIYPSSNVTNSNNTTVTSSPTINVYGSDPQATANAVSDQVDSRLMRSLQGVVR